MTLISIKTIFTSCDTMLILKKRGYTKYNVDPGLDPEKEKKTLVGKLVKSE